MAKVYLDHAAATPLDPAVRRAMQEASRLSFANPGSVYARGRQAKAQLEEARHRVAKVLGAKKSEIIFTAGGTESVNLAILGVGRQHPGKHLITTQIEHSAVLASVAAATREGNVATVLPVPSSGAINVDELEAAITADTVLISIGYANGELGTLQPLAKIGRLVQRVRAARVASGNPLPIWLHSDAAAAAGWLDISVSRLGVDLLSLNGAKIYAPAHSGALYIRHGVQLTPLIWGGGQERGLRSGTPDVAAATGLAVALELSAQQQKAEARRVQVLKDDLLSRLRNIEGLTFNGSQSHCLPGHINFSIAGLSGAELVLYLDEAGFEVATGAACAAASAEPSHVLLALGLSAEQAKGSLRLSLGRSTTAAQLKRFAAALAEVVERLRSRQ